MKRTVLSMIGFLLCALPSACSNDRDQPAPAKESMPVKTDAAAPTLGDPGVPVQQSGSISGRVLFKGKHAPVMLSIGKDKEVCGNSLQDPTLIVGARGEVKNAVVRIRDPSTRAPDVAGGSGSGFRPTGGVGGTAGLPVGLHIPPGESAPVKEANLDQRKCEFVPHVLAIAAGTTVKITNSDGILHNIHTLSKDNPAFNRAQPKYLKEITQTFSQPEIIPVRCDVHGWMGGWIFVAANPYFDVTAADGTFKLAAVLPGKYLVEVWHETLGVQTRQIQVDANQSADASFEFAAKK